MLSATHCPVWMIYFWHCLEGNCHEVRPVPGIYSLKWMIHSCKKFLTINTPKGLFVYNRLPFGVSSAPAIFQRVMDSLFQGCEGVSMYLDDILVTGCTPEEHLKNLARVLAKIAEAGLRLNRSKCVFFAPSVEYLG